MITKTQVKTVLLTLAVLAIVARSPARDYVLGDEKILGIF